MEYIYAALLLHKAGKDVNEDNVKKVLDAAGVGAEEGRIKALIAALDGVNIEEAISAAAPVAAAPAAAPASAGAPAEKKEATEEKKDEADEEQAAAGLGALFG